MATSRPRFYVLCHPAREPLQGDAACLQVSDLRGPGRRRREDRSCRHAMPYELEGIDPSACLRTGSLTSQSLAVPRTGAREPLQGDAACLLVSDLRGPGRRRRKDRSYRHAMPYELVGSCRHTARLRRSSRVSTGPLS